MVDEQVRPLLHWRDHWTEHFLGEWRICTEIIKDPDKGLEQACYWLEEMPDWARRVGNKLRLDVHWGVYGADRVKADAQRIVNVALERGVIAQHEDGFVEVHGMTDHNRLRRPWTN